MRIAMIAVLSASLMSPFLVGCGDKEVASEHKESTNPLTDNKTTTDTKTMQRADGSTYQDTSKQTVPSH